MQTDPVRHLLETLPLPALLIGPDSRVAGLNAAARALLDDTIAGQHYATALRQPDLIETIERCGGAGHDSGQAPFIARGGGNRDITYRATVAWLDLSDLSGVLVTFEDLSPLEHADQMRRDFIANVSHELRTPLTALLGFIETLRGPARDDAPARARFLDIMESEAQRMERLVKDLLSLSRVEDQERMRPTEQVDLTGLGRAVLHALQPLADDTGVSLDIAPPDPDRPDTPVMVPGDKDQLRQVLTNLVENAIKYGGAGGTVTLALTLIARDPSLRGPAVGITVADQGPGIDPLHIPRLTERFYRVDSHRSRQVGGTGLGLAIVKHIVNRHRGRLQVSSTPGKGSRFTVILPAS